MATSPSTTEFQARAVCFQARAAVAHEQDANPEAIGYARSSSDLGSAEFRGIPVGPQELSAKDGFLRGIEAVGHYGRI